MVRALGPPRRNHVQPQTETVVCRGFPGEKGPGWPSRHVGTLEPSPQGHSASWPPALLTTRPRPQRRQPDRSREHTCPARGGQETPRRSPPSPQQPTGRALWSPAHLSWPSQSALLTSWPSRASANSHGLRKARLPAVAAPGRQAHTRPAGRVPLRLPGGPGPSSPRGTTARTSHIRIRHCFLLVSINFQETIPLSPHLWPWYLLLHQKDPSQAEAPGRRVWPPGERRPHRSLAGLEAGDRGAAGTAGALAAEPTGSSHLPLSSRNPRILEAWGRSKRLGEQLR